MNKRTWKVFALILAITVAISLSITSVVRAEETDSNQETEEEPIRSDKWWVSSTVTTPTGTTYYNAAGPDTGIGPTFTSYGYDSIFGSQNNSSGGMVYAGGAPVYTGPGTVGGNLSYGPYAGLVASMGGSTGYNGYNGYNTAAGLGGVAYTGLGTGGVYNGYNGYNGYSGYSGLGYSTGSYAYPTAGGLGYATGSYGYPNTGYATGYGATGYG
jgi:hypothetical protein